MSRRKPIKPDWWVVEHPPAQCRKLMSSKVLSLLDELKNKSQNAKEVQPR